MATSARHRCGHLNGQASLQATRVTLALALDALHPRVVGTAECLLARHLATRAAAALAAALAAARRTVPGLAIASLIPTARATLALAAATLPATPLPLSRPSDITPAPARARLARLARLGHFSEVLCLVGLRN